MKTLSVQEMATGYEVEKPDFWFFVKAGIGFTIGAGMVTMTATVLWWLFLGNLLVGFGRLLTHH